MPKSGRGDTQLRHKAFHCYVFAATMEEVRLHKAPDDSQTLGFLFRVSPHPPEIVLHRRDKGLLAATHT
jgi:hypothetical protein